MQTILLVMLRRPVAQLLMQQLHDVPGVRSIYEPDYVKFGESVASYGADIALIEVQESGKHDMADCLSLCGKLRKQAPGCRVLLLCPEQDEPGVTKAMEAKRDGRIDDFLFYNATTDYMTSKLLAM